MASRPECFGEYGDHLAIVCSACPFISACKEQTDTREIVRQTVNQVRDVADNCVLNSITPCFGRETQNVAEGLQAVLDKAQQKAAKKIEGMG